MASLGATSSKRCVAHKHAEAARDGRAYARSQHAFARAEVEAHGGLVEQQQRWFVQQRARDFDAARLSARQRAHFLVGAIGEPDGLQRLVRARLRFAAPMPCSAAW